MYIKKRGMLRTSMPHWAHACWGWLHNTTELSVETIESLADILPCMICKVHMKMYIRKNRITEPVSLWLHAFHNDVNVRLGKPEFPLPEHQQSAVSSRESLIRFLFAVGFVSDDDRYTADHRKAVMDFFVHGCSSVGIDVGGDLQCQHVSLPRFLFDFFVARGLYSDSFTTLVMDYVPVQLHQKYLSPGEAPKKEKEKEKDKEKEKEKDTIVSTVVLLVGIVVLLSGAGGALYYYYSNNSTKKNPRTLLTGERIHPSVQRTGHRS